MDNGIGKFCLCSTGAGTISRRYNNISIPYDKALANSICYTDPTRYFPLVFPLVKLQRSCSNDGYGFQIKPSKPSLKKIFRRAISGTISRGHRSIVTPIKGAVLAARKSVSEKNSENVNVIESVGSNQMSSLNDTEDDNNYEYDDGGGGGGDASMEGEIQNFHWAQGRAGEDRVHIVISNDHGWVFVGIYDGFNGPDAPYFLLDNLFYAVHNELKAKGLFHNKKNREISNRE